MNISQMKISDLKIGCIGLGVMGGALMDCVGKIVAAKNIMVSDTDPQRAQAFSGKTGCLIGASNDEVVRFADCIFLGVKPVFLPRVLQQIALHLSPSKTPLFVSMAAGVKIEAIAKNLGTDQAKVIRIMPNIAVLLGEGMIGLCSGPSVSPAETDMVCAVLEKAGRVECTDEKLMDAVTAVSGSGPAYGFMFIEALSDAAVRFGMPRKQALVYAAQTLKGAAVMALETGKHPAQLKDEVCSPAGTTIEAVAALENAGFRSAVISAATAAFEKSRELGK